METTMFDGMGRQMIVVHVAVFFLMVFATIQKVEAKNVKEEWPEYMVQFCTQQQNLWNKFLQTDIAQTIGTEDSKALKQIMDEWETQIKKWGNLDSVPEFERRTISRTCDEYSREIEMIARKYDQSTCWKIMFFGQSWSTIAYQWWVLSFPPG